MSNENSIENAKSLRREYRQANYGHEWDRDLQDHGNNTSIACKCGARLVWGMNPAGDPAARKPCPLYVPMTETELAAITKKNTREWTAEERARVSDGAAAVRQARMDALEPFAKLGESYCDETSTKSLASDSLRIGETDITVGMLRAAYRAFNRKV